MTEKGQQKVLPLFLSGIAIIDVFDNFFPASGLFPPLASRGRMALFGEK